MAESTCAVCGGALPPRRTVVCSKQCRAKRLVASEAYKRAQAKRPTHHTPQSRERAKVERVCVVCATTWRTQRKDARYCADCKTVAGREAALRPRSRRQNAAFRLAMAARGRRGKAVWVAGPCAACQKIVVRRNGQRTCSAACSKALKWKRKRGRRTIRRVAIFERDGYRCGLCGKSTDKTKAVPHPKSPVVDHVIPREHGGTHAPANLQCAHFLCNSIKRSEVWGNGEQLRMAG